MPDFEQRLKDFLAERGKPLETVALTADASTREYFRVAWDGVTAIACVYPAGAGTAGEDYLNVTGLVPERRPACRTSLRIRATTKLIIVQEDLGDRILRGVLDFAPESERSDLLDEAIKLIGKIQASTKLAFDLDSVASTRKFDADKLSWELNFFKKHYFGSLKNDPLAKETENAIDAEFEELSKELADQSD